MAGWPEVDGTDLKLKHTGDCHMQVNVAFCFWSPGKFMDFVQGCCYPSQSPSTWGLYRALGRHSTGMDNVPTVDQVNWLAAALRELFVAEG